MVETTSQYTQEMQTKDAEVQSASHNAQQQVQNQVQMQAADQMRVFTNLSTSAILDIGRLTKDPVTQTILTKNGKMTITKIEVATDDHPYRRNGEWVRHTSFFHLDLYGQDAVNMANWGRKGRQLTLRANCRDKQDKHDSSKFYPEFTVTQFLFVDNKDSFANTNNQSAQPANSSANTQANHRHPSTQAKLNNYYEKQGQEKQSDLDKAVSSIKNNSKTLNNSQDPFANNDLFSSSDPINIDSKDLK